MSAHLDSAVAEEPFHITVGTSYQYLLPFTSPAASEPTMEAFFEGTSPVGERCEGNLLPARKL